jgi:cyclic pyranopterin phosphate synthase
MRRLPLVTPPAMKTVRISITDRCDLACFYCRTTRGERYAERQLGRAAWAAILAALTRAGVRRVRITGGEPLLHPEICEVIRDIAALGVDDLALTTNGTRLAHLATPLRKSGLRRINVSLDTLTPGYVVRPCRRGRAPASR